jgi:murein DD-endopeptidase MepM/ murein hydrolase activator NlpD
VVPRSAFVAALGAAALVTTWAILLTWVAFGRDDFVRRFLAREAELKADYDQKVGSLRTRLEQVRTQKMVEHEGLEKRVLDLAGRQASIETRQAVLTGLARQAGPAGVKLLPEDQTGSLPSGSADLAEERGLSALAPTRSAKPTPIPDALGLRTRELDPAERSEASPKSKDHLSALPLAVRLATLERSVETVATAQARMVEGLLTRSRQESRRLRGMMAAVGFDPDKSGRPGTTAGVGGPLVPFVATRTAAGAPLEGEVDLLRQSVAELDGLRRLSAALPLARPTPGEIEVTSGFGYRADPFTRSPALHTGIDLRAEYGTPVRATGAGRVVTAEHVGGYGFMVEIDHGNHLATRYGHLSAIEVVPGQTVAVGTLVGRAGSTGRSTGSHLHYETRIDGEAVDPQRFLRAGSRLAAAN